MGASKNGENLEWERPFSCCNWNLKTGNLYETPSAVFPAGCSGTQAVPYSPLPISRVRIHDGAIDMWS
jgi:hypothetical protein